MIVPAKLVWLMVFLFVISAVNVSYGEGAGVFADKLIKSSNLPIIIVIGEKAAESDVESAKIIQQFLKKHVDGSKIEIRKDSSLKEFEKNNSNLVVIGGPVVNKITAELNDHLDAQFKEGMESQSGQIQVEPNRVVNLVNAKTGFKYGDRFRENFGLGFVQLLENHYRNEGQIIIVVAGIEAEGTKAAARYLTDDTSEYPKIQGSLAIIHSVNGKTRIIDPHMSVYPSSMSFSLDSTTARQLEISNGGEVVTLVNISTSDPRITVSEDSVTMEPGDIVSVDVGVDTDSDRAKLQNGSIMLVTDNGIEIVIPVLVLDNVPEIILEKSLNRETYLPNSNFTITLRMNNVGTADAINVTMRDFRHDWMIKTEGDYAFNGNIESNGSVGLSYSGIIAQWIDPGNYLLGRATVSYEDKKGNTFSSESDDIVMRIKNVPNVHTRIEFQDSMKSDSAGEIRIVVTNNWQYPVSPYEVDLMVPNEFTIIDIQPETGWMMDFGFRWNLGILEPGESYEIYAKIKSPKYDIGTEAKKETFQLSTTVGFQDYEGDKIMPGTMTFQNTKDILVDPNILLDWGSIINNIVFTVIGLVGGIFLTKRFIRH